MIISFHCEASRLTGDTLELQKQTAPFSVVV